jgi:predicted RNA-binding Zn-ribbon protein involved in translation (DUF1610 family)
MVGKVVLKTGKPAKCPFCGCEKIYKNGYYRLKAARIRRALELEDLDEVKVQMFSCSSCGRYLKSKETEFRLNQKNISEK